MTFDALLKFIERDMRMSHVYQPVVLRTLLSQGGQASTQELAAALLQRDRSQVEYYLEIVKRMVGKVLLRRGIVSKEGQTWRLRGFDVLSPKEILALQAACDRKLEAYVMQRGNAIWEHRRRSHNYISGTLRYEVLKESRFRCELCGVSAEERALEVDHIIPRRQGGMDDLTNLQALCFRCNAMKRDRDATDLRRIRAALGTRDHTCAFCVLPSERILAENALAFAVRDLFPVTPLHTVVIVKRHVVDLFELGMPEVRACHQLLEETQRAIRESDASVSGFNVGANIGTDAGQTVPHCHYHLIPRRKGDVENPRGGIRNVIPGKGDY